MNDISLPQGDFVTNLGSLRVTYNFTPRINVQGLVQYNDLTDRWSTNLRLNLQQTAATGLYVVYNDTEAFNGLGPVNRAFIIKLLAYAGCAALIRENADCRVQNAECFENAERTMQEFLNSAL